jgi:hypothetical protein
VTRNERLRKVENLVDVAYAELTGSEHIENPDTRRIGEPFEQLVEDGDIQLDLFNDRHNYLDMRIRA